MCTSSLAQRAAASFEAGARARLATSAKSTLRRPGRAAPTEQATHHGVAPEALPEPLESVEAAQRSRLQELEGLGGEERRPGIGLRREEARKRALERRRLSESKRPKL